MPPDAPSKGESSSGHGHGRHKERIGNYIVGSEIGRGSFATVYKGYKSKSREPIAIKAVSRQKLTTKLLENSESEINILKAISHPNITALEDCFKNDTHIYLVMEYCSGSDSSVYIKNRGRLATSDYVPHGSLDGEKIFYPHPPTGGIAERVTRSFLGQSAHALHFSRDKNSIHRDIKPQNLLLQPASETDVAAGHPLGIPSLKVADFGFARILPASAMAETLCGSPLYMAPEILRYEKYDAKVDLWSVGAVSFEMAVGKPPFRAANHVELLRKIEKGEDRIKFPDESSRQSSDPDSIPPLPVSADIKALIRGLLKRHAADRMSFEQFFGSSHVWDEHMSESHSTEEGSLSLEVSTDSSNTEEQSFKDARGTPEFSTRQIQPVATDPALNPQPARLRSDLKQPMIETRSISTEPQRVVTEPRPQVRPPQPIRRSEPKYYVQDDSPTSPVVPAEAPLSGPRPIQNPAQRSQRRLSGRESASVEDAQPITPGSNHPVPMHRPRGVGEGSPLAATPPITVNTTGKDESALEGDDSMVARDYVVIEKRTVEVNASADEMDQASRQPTTTLARRPSSRTSVVSRPISSFKPSETAPPRPVVQTTVRGNNPGAPMSYSPPFGLSSTPPFAIPPVSRQPSITQSPLTVTNRNASNVNVFPPVQIYESSPRYSSSPGSHQPGALARVLTNTARRVLGTTANVATHALARAASGRRPAIVRTRQIDPEEDALLDRVEEQARFAFVLFEFGDERLTAWQQLSEAASPASQTTTRRPSNSSQSSQVDLSRQQELAAGQSCISFVKALSFIVRATRTIREFTEKRNAAGEYQASQELNDMVQWLRARFNECFEKVEFAKARYAAEESPFIEKSILDRARDFSIAAANHEKAGDYAAAEIGYETSSWSVQTLLDEIMWDGQVKEEDRIAIEPWVNLIGGRLRDFRKKSEARKQQARESLPSSPTSDIKPAVGAFPRERTYSATVPGQADQTKMSSPVSTPAMPSSAPTTSGTTVVRSTYKPATTTYTPAPLNTSGGTPT